MQHLTLDLVELHEVCTDSFFKIAKVCMEGFPFLQCVNCTTHHGVMANLLRMHWIPLIMSPTNILNNIDPWGAPLTTDLHLDIELLTTILCVWQISWFFIHPDVNPSHPCPSSFESRMLKRLIVVGRRSDGGDKTDTEEVPKHQHFIVLQYNLSYPSPYMHYTCVSSLPFCDWSGTLQHSMFLSSIFFTCPKQP